MGRSPHLKTSDGPLSLLLSRFSISFSYYGLAMDLQNFGVSIYLIQVIFGAVDFPAKVVVTVSLSYIGRRVSLMVALFFAGLVIIANIFVPTGGWPGVMAGRVAPTPPALLQIFNGVPPTLPPTHGTRSRVPPSAPQTAPGGPEGF